MFDVDGLPHRPDSREVDWDDDRCEKDGFETFMLKEIHEQGRGRGDALARGGPTCAAGPVGAMSDERLRNVNRIIIVACGTSYHAGLAGRMAIERWARIPVEVDVASEFRYRDPIIGPGTLVLAITQSGETADTLAAMRLARARGATVLAVTNAPGSQATRTRTACCSRAPESRSASRRPRRSSPRSSCCTRSRCTSRASRRDAVSRTAARSCSRELELLPDRIDQVVSSVDASVRELAERLAWSPFFLYLGRLSGLPVALEGALKLKEISYVPTDAYAAGEMKHGPIALLSRDTPVICVATEESVLPKLLSNLSEVRARGARVFAVASEGMQGDRRARRARRLHPADRSAAAGRARRSCRCSCSPTTSPGPAR